MMRSLFSGVSGLRNHQTRMDVIGNNIANVNTVGFKGSRVNFQDVLSQTIQGAASAQGARGGTNPMQVGLGMGLSSIDTIFTDGSFQPTGKQTDLSIQGQGFFVLQDATGAQVFTRAGNFDFDQQGNYLVPGTGYKVMGYNAVNGVVGTVLGPLQVPVGTSIAPQISTAATFTKNLDANTPIAPAAGSSFTKTITAYDGSGMAHPVTMTFTHTAANTWTALPTPGDGTSTVATLPVAATPTTITFNGSGAYVGVAGTTSFTVTPVPAAGGVATLTVNFAGMTQYAGDTTAVGDANGYKTGSLQNVSIDTNGNLIGRFDNGQSQVMGRVALALFENPAGLTKTGSNLFIESNNSGTAAIDVGGAGGRGTFNPGTLEMANVDLAAEFSNMIITQRGFQANSKIISVTDEMLQELANLKR